MIIAGVVALLLLGAVVMTQQSKQTQPSQETTSTTMPAEEANVDEKKVEKKEKKEGDEDVNEVEAVEIEAGSFYFKPNKIKVDKGQKVRVTLKAVSLMHNFTIDEFNVKSETVQNGNTGIVEFTPDKAGTFEFYCGIGQHRANGQKGTLIVEE